ncbi:MAG: hypothetical protein XD90_2136 [Methanobacterium sp. 42_16]|nr:MAG: hypothetical protein XD90_2136 [Methanobacterium sp. 42_16]
MYSMAKEIFPLTINISAYTVEYFIFTINTIAK